MSAIAQQLTWIETLLKGSIGLILCLLPLTAAKLLGLPVAASGFWPRLLGAIMVGLAAALFLEGRGGGPRGLGMAGLVIINLAALVMLFTLLVSGRAATTGRGKMLLWVVTVVMLLMTLAEIAYV